MKNSQKKALRRRRIIAILAALVAGAMILMSTVVAGAGAAFADERDDAVAAQEESRRKIADLNDHLDDIDEELSDLFLAMEQTNLEVASAKEELVIAQEELAAAQRQLQQVTDQLEDAEALKTELESAIEENKIKEAELSSAVGSMAREMYRGDNVSPLQIVVQTEDLGDVSSRAAAATALSRAQSKALDDVRFGLVVTENQNEKQEAVTARITELKAEAEEAFEAAEAAALAVEERVASLEALQVEQAAAQASWEARKSDVAEQLEDANKELEEHAAKIAAIDLARAKAEAAAREAAASAAESAPASNGNAMLGSPLATLRITSQFGYRTHPIYGVRILHNGTDFGAACGTTQYATRGGTVIAAGYTSVAGNYLQINHGVINGSSYITNHSHAQKLLVSVGQQVSAGDPVALTGTTGSSTGCHLHFTLYRDGVPVNPLDYM